MFRAKVIQDSGKNLGRLKSALIQRIPELRAAIEDLSKGRTVEGFDKLDKFGAIQEIADDADRLAAIAVMQIKALKAQRSSLIVAPTHGECRAIAGAVRKAMKENGLLIDSEHSVTRLQRLNLTDSRRSDAVTYEPGQIVEFHRIAKGAARAGVQEKRFKSDEQWEVLRREEGTVIVGKGGHREAVATRPVTEVHCVRAREDRVDNRRPDPIYEKIKHCGHKFLNNGLRTVVSINVARSYSTKARSFAMAPLCISTRE